MPSEYELLRTQMETLAEHLESLDDNLDPEVMAGVLRCLVEGWTVPAIIEEFDLEHEDGV